MSVTEFTMMIDGAAVAGAGTIHVINPATEQVFADAPDCSSEQLDAAVAAARRAFPAWRATPLDQRRALLRAFGEAIKAQIEALAPVLTGEQGKPLDMARIEIAAGVRWCRVFAEMPLESDVIEDSEQRRIEVQHVPLGVVGAIAPWNFPVALALQKVAPALIAGNTLVLKPSPLTPLTTLRIGEIARGIFPPGVINVVSGGDALGPWLTSHPGVDKITFTGSTATGRKVMASAAQTLKRVTLELGGNDAAIILPDVDVEAVARQLFDSAFANSGQICVATKRLYVHAQIYDRVAAALSALAGAAKVSDGSAPGVQYGPVQNAAQYARLIELLDDARDSGCAFLTGGSPIDGPGYFLPLTLVDNPPEDARIVAEEQFGPILPLLKFHDVDEVIARANASEFGLGGQIWSGDAEAGAALAARLDTGNVWVNQMQTLYPHAPFGGHKQSGMGVELGRDGLLAYTNPRTVVTSKRPVAA